VICRFAEFAQFIDNGRVEGDMQAPIHTLLAGLALLVVPALAGDWPGFRGLRNGVAEPQDVPLTWSDDENLAWKLALPGGGASSPIVVGDSVIVTCFSGRDANLVRHVVCADRKSGEIAWQVELPSAAREDKYSGFLTEHGYASSTPVSDGERVYLFFGKAGVLAYDLEGRHLWQANVGSGSSIKRWGSASSPLVYQDLLIVNAADESETLFAFNKVSGELVWKTAVDGLALTFGTPQIMTVDGRDDLVLSVPGELWGMNPATGKLRWLARTPVDSNASPSALLQDGVIYALGGRHGGSIAVRAGGKGDVSDSHVLWRGRESSYVATPIAHDGHLFWVDDRGMAVCINASNGRLAYRERLEISGSGRAAYASPIRVGDHFLAVTRQSGAFVIKAAAQFAQVAHNRFADDDSDFNASPAVANGQVFLRSQRFLYCIQNP
jgi:outer membrane protein assembly factor BamB